MPGSIVLGGWRPLPRGELGQGPRCPKLLVLVESGISIELLEKYVDELFTFNGDSPPMLLRGGELRPMMHAVTASIIMYYEERFAAGEMGLVLQHMRDAFCVFLFVEKPHDLLIKWGGAIRRDFKSANLHLTAGMDLPGQEQVISCIQQQGQTMGMLQSQLTQMAAATARLETQLQSLLAGSSVRRASEPLPPTPPCPEPEQQQQQQGQPCPEPEQQQQQQGWGSLVPDNGSDPIRRLANYAASQFYLDAQARGGTCVRLSSADKSRGDVAYEWFNRMATADEKATLLARPRDKTEANRIADRLTKLVRARIAQGYRDMNESVPPRLNSGEFFVNSLIPHTDKLTSVKPATFQAWRASYSPEGESVAIAAAAMQRPAKRKVVLIDAPPPTAQLSYR